MEMAKRGVSHRQMRNGTPTRDYMKLSATLPSYLKEKADLEVASSSNIDATLFENIVPNVAIDQTFVGQEPPSPVTSVYTTH